MDLLHKITITTNYTSFENKLFFFFTQNSYHLNSHEGMYIFMFKFLQCHLRTKPVTKVQLQNWILSKILQIYIYIYIYLGYIFKYAANSFVNFIVPPSNLLNCFLWKKDACLPNYRIFVSNCRIYKNVLGGYQIFVSATVSP